MKNNDYNLNDEPNLPSDNNGKNPFGLPADYFSKFGDKLKQRLELENELNEFPLLSSIQKNNAFLIPDNYFKSIEYNLEYKVELDAYPNLEAVKKPVFTDLAEDYKKQLQASLNYKIGLIEELSAYQTLYVLDKTNPFSVSPDYFENFSTRVKERIHSTKQTKVSVLDKVLDVLFGKTMAFSFGLALIIGLVVFFNQSPESIIESGDCKTLACLERQEILNNSNVITDFDEDQLMELVDVNSLNKQLNPKKENSPVDEKINFDSISEEDVLDEL